MTNKILRLSHTSWIFKVFSNKFSRALYSSETKCSICFIRPKKMYEHVGSKIVVIMYSRHRDIMRKNILKLTSVNLQMAPETATLWSNNVLQLFLLV